MMAVILHWNLGNGVVGPTYGLCSQKLEKWKDQDQLCRRVEDSLFTHTSIQDFIINAEEVIINFNNECEERERFKRILNDVNSYPEQYCNPQQPPENETIAPGPADPLKPMISLLYKAAHCMMKSQNETIRKHVIDQLHGGMVEVSNNCWIITLERKHLDGFAGIARALLRETAIGFLESMNEAILTHPSMKSEKREQIKKYLEMFKKDCYFELEIPIHNVAESGSEKVEPKILASWEIMKRGDNDAEIGRQLLAQQSQDVQESAKSIFTKLGLDESHIARLVRKPEDLEGRVKSYYDKFGYILLDFRHFRDPHGFVDKLTEAGFEAFLDHTNDKGDLINEPIWKTRCVKCQVILYEWNEDDIPMDEHYRTMDKFCPLVIKYYTHLKKYKDEAAGDTETEEEMDTDHIVAGAAEEMDVGFPNPAPGDVCLVCNSKEKVQYSPCGHLWCMQCVNKYGALQDRCPVCLNSNVQSRVYQPEKLEIAKRSLEQIRRAQLARAFLHSTCDICQSKDKLVLLECKDIVCSHYRDGNTCPTCNGKVVDTRYPDVKLAKTHY